MAVVLRDVGLEALEGTLDEACILRSSLRESGLSKERLHATPIPWQDSVNAITL